MGIPAVPATLYVQNSKTSGLMILGGNKTRQKYRDELLQSALWQHPYLQMFHYHTPKVASAFLEEAYPESLSIFSLNISPTEDYFIHAGLMCPSEAAITNDDCTAGGCNHSAINQ